jgi:hypothetical protein
MWDGVVPAVVFSALISALVAIVTALITSIVAERKLRREHQLDFMAEAAAKELLKDARFRLRSFPVIRHHLAGFDDDELRRVLVRSGALRWNSKSGLELWGLLSRNHERLSATKLDVDPNDPAPEPCRL